jgi:sulfopyruvate decarboxylase subunit beta
VKRADLIRSILPRLEEAAVVCNLGFPSRELHHLGDRDANFYMLGSMGLCSSIALGLSLTTDRPVVALEGDGSVLMNLGTLTTIANHAPPNLVVLIVDNGTYGSTGDQPTATRGRADLAALARGAGVSRVLECRGEDAAAALAEALGADEATVIVAEVEPGNLPTPTISMHPVSIRDRFRAALTSGSVES